MTTGDMDEQRPPSHFYCNRTKKPLINFDGEHLHLFCKHCKRVHPLSWQVLERTWRTISSSVDAVEMPAIGVERLLMVASPLISAHELKRIAQMFYGTMLATDESDDGRAWQVIAVRVEGREVYGSVREVVSEDASIEVGQVKYLA